FLWVHYFGAHERWPDEADVAQTIAAITQQYPRSVSRTDSEVGRLVQALVDLGVARNTLVVLHGDHGQSLLEHGYLGHGNDLYEPSMRVPLLMWQAGTLPAGRHVNTLVRLIDIFPTVAELSGIRSPDNGDGRSLVPLMRGTATGGVGDAFCETTTA